MDDLITSVRSKRGGALILQLTGVILALIDMNIFFLQLFLLVSICVHLPTPPLSLSTCRPTAAPSW